MFDKVLIANRGEIAVRIARTLRDMGIGAVAVYSEADRGSLHVELADEAYFIGPAPAAESYLRGERLLEVARASGCDALIPGYGFLSEQAGFARACTEAGVVFVGPPPEAMEVMGLKPEARAHMAQAGVPIVPGGPAQSLSEALASASQIGFPLLIKAAAGGGGRGMRRADNLADLKAHFERAQSEALAAFGDGTLYLEKWLAPARHIEIQVMGDQHGGLVHLFDRDCSVQRRHQKVVEESPSPSLPEDARAALCQIALRGARSVGYYSAGTFEFLVDSENNPYFLEMNTRLQVEHPVTELCCGVDLVAEMLRVAAGLPLSFTQAQVQPRGASVECRLYAEVPEKGFLPSPGRVVHYRPPEGPGVRLDSGVRAGSEVTRHYDPLMAKLCVWGPDRDTALARMRRAIDEFELEGPGHNLDFHRRLLDTPAFRSGHYHTGFIEENRQALLTPSAPEFDERLAAAVWALHDHAQRTQLPTLSDSRSSESQWVAAQRRARVGL